MKTLEEAELCFPQLLNSSCRKTMRPHALSMLSYILLSSISVLTVTLNLLVIISISHFRQLHTPTNLLLLSLAFSDFFVGFLMLYQIILLDGCWLFGDLMCTLSVYLSYLITSASIGTMVLISVDRYVAICQPLHYLNKVTQKRVTVCNCLCWTCSAFLHSLLLKDNLAQPGRYNSCLGECVIVINYIAGIADLFFSFIGPVTVIIVLYMRVFVVAVTQARAMRSHIAALPLKRSVTVTDKKSEMKAARNLGVIIVVFLLCICPYFSAILTGQDTLFNTSTATFVTCLFYVNSLLNPVIYAFLYPWFRKSIKFIVTFKILKPGSYMTNIM
ncbi:trace amine-associated receptor 13c-like [Pseudoliparis swirei]|uniref:trace amine-associated receptor 13c-like n=1 Tax=Pseudoliparis swirei TaxID=2059687 RepID=UPI0024BE1B0F|nr:trace amine-associated receptor 13c-like [Pseudoliparis swirei]